MSRRVFWLALAVLAIANGAFLFSAQEVEATGGRFEYTWEGKFGPIETCPTGSTGCDVSIE